MFESPQQHGCLGMLMRIFLYSILLGVGLFGVVTYVVVLLGRG